MTIGEQITRLRTNVANAFEAIKTKGGELPSVLNSDYLAETIAAIVTALDGYKKDTPRWSWTDSSTGGISANALNSLTGTISESISSAEYSA